jgi:hypothetical protein
MEQRQLNGGEGVMHCATYIADNAANVINSEALADALGQRLGAHHLHHR